LSQKATFRANGAERLRLSRRRAGIVRQYVVGKNEVVLKNVVFIRVGGSSDQPDKKRRGYVAPTLFLKRAELQIVDPAHR